MKARRIIQSRRIQDELPGALPPETARDKTYTPRGWNGHFSRQFIPSMCMAYRELMSIKRSLRKAYRRGQITLRDMRYKAMSL